MKQIRKDGCMVALNINNILTEALDQQWGRRKTKKVKTTGKATKAKPQRHINQKLLLLLITLNHKKGAAGFI